MFFLDTGQSGELQHVNVLLATTYQKELTRLYAPSGPHVTQLGTTGPFRLCPACIAEVQLLRRTFVLPHIHFCPHHQMVLVSTCQCGTSLQLFSQQSPPFICYKCGKDWANLPRFLAPPEYFKQEQTVLSYFEFFFTQGTPQLLAHALRIIREKLKKEKIAQVKLLNGQIKQVEHYELTKASLSYLIDLLIGLNLSPLTL